MIEADKVKPNRLQYILFTGTGKKGVLRPLGSAVTGKRKSLNTREMLFYNNLFTNKGLASGADKAKITNKISFYNTLYFLNQN